MILPDDAYPVVIFSNQSLSIRIINASVASRVSHDVHSQMIGTWDFLWNKTVQCQVYSESSPLFLVKIRGDDYVKYQYLLYYIS